MFLTLITFLSAISISVIAAGYSIIGLAAIFAGATVPIIAMGSALEVGKLVAASWLYQNWNNSLVPRLLKTYLFGAIVILVFITSMGIFGFLSKAHLDQVQPGSNNTLQIGLLDNQINQQQKIIDRSQNTLNQLDAALDKYIDMEYVTRGLKEREKQKEERIELNLAIKNASTEIAKLENEKFSYQKDQLKLEADVGPLKYIAELIYGEEEARTHFDEAVRLVIIILIFVFDPLAVLLLIAANISLRERKLKKRLEETNEKEKVEKNLERTKRQNQKLRRKERDFRKMVANVGDLQGLNEDEIKVKLNQIYDWNEKK